MDLSDKDIELIERYLQGQMEGEERAAFESLLQSDAELAGEVELFRDLIAGSKQAGRQQLKKSLAGIEAGLAGAGAFSAYEPSKQAPKPKPKGKSGGSAGSIISFFVLAALVAAGYMYYTGKLEIPVLDKYFRQEHTIIDTVYHEKVIITRDTVWHEIEVPIADTTAVGLEDLIEEEAHPTGRQPQQPNPPAGAESNEIRVTKSRDEVRSFEVINSDEDDKFTEEKERIEAEALRRKLELQRAEKEASAKNQ